MIGKGGSNLVSAQDKGPNINSPPRVRPAWFSKTKTALLAALKEEDRFGKRSAFPQGASPETSVGAGGGFPSSSKNLGNLYLILILRARKI